MKDKKAKRLVQKATAKQKRLKQELAASRGDVTRTEARLQKAKDRKDRWKQEAIAQREAAARAAAEVEKLQRRLAEAAAALEAAPSTTQDDAPSDDAPSDDSAFTDGPSDAAGTGTETQTKTEGTVVPDESWTVVQLRAEARARGLSGMSNKPKAELLAALT